MTFSQLSTYFAKIEAVSSRIAMTQILAELFGKASDAEIGEICYLLQGRTVPLYEAVEFGIADKFMIKAIALAYDQSTENVTRAFKKFGDMGKAAESLHKGKGSLSVSDVFRLLDTLAREAGAGSQEKKITLLAELLRGVDALSARFVARIPLDKLRLGFSDMTILDALSWMEKGDKSLRPQLEDAYNKRPDIAHIAKTMKKDKLQGLGRVRVQVGAPILASLCTRLPNAQEMIKKMGKVAVEPKYDGVRVQIHYKHGEIRAYSRNLENTTAMFPELTGIGKEFAAKEVIFDSEAVGYDAKNDKLIPFQVTVTRKRKHGVSEASLHIPLRFFVFDILYKDGKDLLFEPLSRRREILTKTLTHPHHLVVSPEIVTSSAAEIRSYHQLQRKKGLEGVVVKKWDSKYEPGRKGFHWVKFKEEEGQTGKLTDTIDAVVMGYYRGEGKRAGFGIGAFLVGVAKGDTFVTVTKIGTGVSDELWRQLREKLNAIRVTTAPKQYMGVHKSLVPDVWVTPKIVVELAGDDLTKSPSHGAGYAVRFPRLVGIRTDKSPREVTTVSEIATMYRQQSL